MMIISNQSMDSLVVRLDALQVHRILHGKGVEVVRLGQHLRGR